MRRSLFEGFMAFVVASGFGMTFSAAWGQPALQKVTIATAADSLQYIAQDLAIDNGFFAQEGLQADLVVFDSGTRQSAAIMSGGGTVGPVGLIHTIKASAAGGDLVAVSRLFDVLDVFIIVSNDALGKTGITAEMPIDEKVRRMRGLRIGITGPGSTVDTSVRALFKARGIDPDKEVQLLPLGAPANMIAAMEKGATDAFAYPAPWPTIAANRGLGKIVVDPFVDQIPEIKGVPFNIVAAGRETATHNPDLVRKIVRAYARAMKFARDKPEEAKLMIRKRFPELDDNLFNALWVNYRKAIPTDPVITPEQFSRTQTWLNLTASPPFKQTYDQVISSDAAREASRDIMAK